MAFLDLMILLHFPKITQTKTFINHNCLKAFVNVVLNTYHQWFKLKVVNILIEAYLTDLNETSLSEYLLGDSFVNCFTEAGSWMKLNTTSRILNKIINWNKGYIQFTWCTDIRALWHTFLMRKCTYQALIIIL